MKKKWIWGIILIVLLLLVFLGIKFIFPKTPTQSIYGAVDQTEKNIFFDEDFLGVARSSYLVYHDRWNAEDLIKNTVAREDGTPYDFIYFSDFEVLNAYRNSEHHDASLVAEAIFSTPIVFYSWDTVVDQLVQQKIVREENDVFYIIDMEKLLNYIIQDKTWKEISVILPGDVNIITPDPFKNALGRDYYELLFCILKEDTIPKMSDEQIITTIKKLSEHSSYRIENKDTLFELYIRAGVNAIPLMVGYEQDMVLLSSRNNSALKQIKEHMRILYPLPTLYHSKYYAPLTDAGREYLNILEQASIQQRIWNQYGLRTTFQTAKYDITKTEIPGISNNIPSVTKRLDHDTKNLLFSSLEEK